MHRTKEFALCALFAALTAVFSQIALPIGPVPLNLATLAVYCAGALIGSRRAALSMAVWVALGAAGAPVFAMFSGGPGALIGPTGGYIVGFIPAAVAVGYLIEKRGRGGRMTYPAAMLAGMLVCFALGTAWFALSTGAGVWNALTLCVIPFVPGEAAKIAVAVLVAKRLRTHMR